MYGSLISSVTVASTTNSITFTSIPQTPFTDLFLVLSADDTGGGTSTQIRLSVNGSTTKFSYTLEGSGSTVQSSVTSSAQDLRINSGANFFGNAIVHFPNYAGSTNKTFAIDYVTENTATQAFQGIVTGMISNTAAITSIGFTLSATNLELNTTAYLYGLTKGSGGATVS
jgi:hypothetical protein